MNFKISMQALSPPSTSTNTRPTCLFLNFYLRSKLSYFLVLPTLLPFQRWQLKLPRLRRNFTMNSNKVEQNLIESNLLMNKHQSNPHSNIESSNWGIRLSLKLPTQQICVLMTRSLNKARMEENSVNLQNHVTVDEITGSANALTRRKERVTPKRNRKSPPRNFQLLLLWAFNVQAMWKTPAFLLMWSWKCWMTELRLLHSLALVWTTITFCTSSSYWKVFTLLVNSYCHLPSSTEPRPTVLLIRSSTSTFSIMKQYLNCLNSKLMPLTCKDTTCLSAEIGYIRSTQMSSGIPHVGTTGMLAQWKSRSTIPHTFPRSPVARRLTFFLS